MECTHCRDVAQLVLVGTKFRFCRTCAALVNAQDWAGLAARWLKERPEDWQGDVAAYLEAIMPEERHCESVVRNTGVFLPGPNGEDRTLN